MTPTDPIPIHHLDDTASTNADARAMIAQANGPLWVIARAQSAGRGRDGRTWLSPPGGLWATLAWPLAASPPNVLNGLGLRIGVALCRALSEFCPDARLKWPNDILIKGAKVAGVLTEVVDGWILIGCGVNVANDPPTLPPPAAATSLKDHIAHPLTTDAVRAAIEPRLVDALSRAGVAEDLPAARALLWGVGQACLVHDPAGDRRALLVGLADDGSAIYR